MSTNEESKELSIAPKSHPWRYRSKYRLRVLLHGCWCNRWRNKRTDCESSTRTIFPSFSDKCHKPLLSFFLLIAKIFSCVSISFSICVVDLLCSLHMSKYRCQLFFFLNNLKIKIFSAEVYTRFKKSLFFIYRHAIWMLLSF